MLLISLKISSKRFRGDRNHNSVIGISKEKIK